MYNVGEYIKFHIVFKGSFNSSNVTTDKLKSSSPYIIQVKINIRMNPGCSPRAEQFVNSSFESRSDSSLISQFVSSAADMNSIISAELRIRETQHTDAHCEAWSGKRQKKHVDYN